MKLLSDEVRFVPYSDRLFQSICTMYAQEGWTTPAERGQDFRRAVENSGILICALCGDELAGFLRGLTDGFVTAYVAEIIIRSDMRSRGLGRLMLEECSRRYPDVRIDLLSASDAAGFYISCGFKPYKGFRRNAKGV